MSLFNYLFSHRKLGIRRGDFVVEIGSGGAPFLRSDILVERFIEDGIERHIGIILDRAAISADGATLPFPDKSIDFIFCSHVLEHIPDPESFLNEMSRVGKRGYIVTPHGDYEMLDPRRCHLWSVWNEGGILYLKQKKSWDEYPEVSAYYRKITALPGYWSFFGKHYPAFNTILEWEGKIDYQIEKHNEFDLSKFRKASDTAIPQANATIPPKQRIRSWVSKAIRPLISAHWSIDPNNNILCCPLCKGTLSPIVSETTYTKCNECGAKFPVKGLIARLVKEEAIFENTAKNHKD